MNQTFQNSAQVLSIGIFFTLMIIGLASTLPGDDERRAGLPTASPPAYSRTTWATLPPVSILFAAFLGYNPIEHLARGRTCSRGSSAHDQAVGHRSARSSLTLIPGPFRRRAPRRVPVRDHRLPDRGLRHRCCVAGA